MLARSSRRSPRSSPLPPGAVKPEPGLLHEEDSLYQFIQVVERPDGRRLLRLNEGVAVHSVWRADTVLTGGVWDAFLALPPLLDRPLRSVAILGNAAGTTARALGVFYPEARVDGVELDPAVSRVGREYFGMGDNPRLTVHDADARPFLRRTDERYDLIVVDAYHQPYVPVLPRDARVLPARPRAARRRAASSRSTSPRCRATTACSTGSPGTLTHEFDVGRGLAGAALQQDPDRLRRAAGGSTRIVSNDRPAELRPLRRPARAPDPRR